jgi:hypothetical protein
MPVTLGSVTFDEVNTTVREKIEEVGGRNERRITLSGLVLGESSVAAIEARLDAMLDAASLEDYSGVLSLRAGRRLLVRRDAFKREVRPEELAGVFTLELAARDPFEESAAETLVSWSIAASGATKSVASSGTADARPVIALTAVGALIDPAVSDGPRTMSFSGTVSSGKVLTMDAAAGRVMINDTDVTPYTAGHFPRIAPEGTTLRYTDAAGSSHTASATVRFRGRWW